VTDKYNMLILLGDLIAKLGGKILSKRHFGKRVYTKIVPIIVSELCRIKYLVAKSAVSPT
jgi:hypothetical protein